MPGLVGTEGRDVWAENMAKQQNVSKDEFVASFCKRMGILAGRWAEMDEVADTVVFLASDRARYYNGAKIILDGGLNVNVRDLPSHSLPAIRKPASGRRFCNRRPAAI